jgi:hypothetical protein
MPLEAITLQQARPLRKANAAKTAVVAVVVNTSGILYGSHEEETRVLGEISCEQTKQIAGAVPEIYDSLGVMSLAEVRASVVFNTGETELCSPSNRETFYCVPDRGKNQKKRF